MPSALARVAQDEDPSLSSNSLSFPQQQGCGRPAVGAGGARSGRDVRAARARGRRVAGVARMGGVAARAVRRVARAAREGAARWPAVGVGGGAAAPCTRDARVGVARDTAGGVGAATRAGALAVALSLAPPCTPWHPLAPPGTPLHPLAPPCTLVHPLARCGRGRVGCCGTARRNSTLRRTLRRGRHRGCWRVGCGRGV